MARERGQKIAHALLERAQLRLDEDLSDERVGSQLDQFLSCGVELEEEEEEMQMKSLSEKQSSSRAEPSEIVRPNQVVVRLHFVIGKPNGNAKLYATSSTNKPGGRMTGLEKIGSRI